MQSRKVFLAVALSGAATMSLLAYGQQATRQPASTRQQTDAHPEHAQMLRTCAKACGDCQQECDACATHCAHMLHAAKTEHAATLFACQDCADVCAAAAQIVARGGPYAESICKACADVCAQCALECEKFPDDEHMKRCAEECRKCKKACHEMLGHSGGEESGSNRTSR